ncbi:hypothetical protein IQ25_04126 [Novosphingobium taihuense]|nr:hypothetical protein IQ25_04126 [Novosphingobium taihuense]
MTQKGWSLLSVLNTAWLFPVFALNYDMDGSGGRNGAELL